MPCANRLPLLALLLLVGACSQSTSTNDERPTPPEGARPVILISIDSLRADHCSPWGYTPEFAPHESTTPFMQKLADEGVTFENCSASSPWTLPSHVSILSGMHPIQHGVRARRFRMADDTDLVSQRFQDAGYLTAGFYSAPFLHGVWGFYRGFDVYEPALEYLQSMEAAEALVNRGSKDIHKFHSLADGDRETAPFVIDKAIDWLKKDDHYKEPFFLFLHMWDPHYDYFPPAEYAERFHPNYTGEQDGGGFNDADAVFSDDDMAHFLALYDAEIRYTDDHIARLYAQLEELGIADDVVFAIVSDHGDEFGEHGQRGHHKTLYEEVMHVPMVVRAVGDVPAGTRVSETVANYDIAPTLLDLAGLAEWPGRSGKSTRPLWESENSLSHEVLMDLLHPGRKLDLRGWRHGSDKALWDTRGRKFSTFDLSVDPDELSPFYVTQANENSIVQQAMKFFNNAHSNAGAAAAMQESGEMTQTLAELGYAEDE